MVKYHLYDENYTYKGSFTSIQQMRNYLCERKNMIMMIELIWMIHLIISNLSKWYWDLSEEDHKRS